MLFVVSGVNYLNNVGVSLLLQFVFDVVCEYQDFEVVYGGYELLVLCFVDIDVVYDVVVDFVGCQ